MRLACLCVCVCQAHQGRQYTDVRTPSFFARRDTLGARTRPGSASNRTHRAHRRRVSRRPPVPPRSPSSSTASSLASSSSAGPRWLYSLADRVKRHIGIASCRGASGHLGGLRPSRRGRSGPNRDKLDCDREKSVESGPHLAKIGPPPVEIAKNWQNPAKSGRTRAKLGRNRAMRPSSSEIHQTWPELAPNRPTSARGRPEQAWGSGQFWPDFFQIAPPGAAEEQKPRNVDLIFGANVVSDICRHHRKTGRVKMQIVREVVCVPRGQIRRGLSEEDSSRGPARGVLGNGCRGGTCANTIVGVILGIGLARIATALKRTCMDGKET